MEGKMQVMIGTPDSGFWRKFASIPESKDISVVRFSSIEQACDALTRDNVLLIFCENQLVDGTYEDLLTAAKNVRSQARIVVTGLDSAQFDSLGYCRAMELGAFDVLRESFGTKDLEWVVICAMRDEAGARMAPSGATQPGANRLN
jgi:DNA-binding NtrC family response regulator